jgi:hypothetical protein
VSEIGNSNGGFSDVNIGTLISNTNVMGEVEINGLHSQEDCNAEISDPIAPFGDDDDYFSFGGDDEIGSGEAFGYEYTEYGSDVEIPESEFQSNGRWTAFSTISTKYASQPRCH